MPTNVTYICLNLYFFCFILLFTSSSPCREDSLVQLKTDAFWAGTKGPSQGDVCLIESQVKGVKN